jgi:rubredoxin/desulfoferrodoxin (superoxide reductase-like protein)
MKYHCTWCWYVYDERNGEYDLWISPNTIYEDLPNDFFCPMCETHKDDFVLLEKYVHFPLSSWKISTFEAEHMPIFQINEDSLLIEVWQVDHPMQEDHYITKILLLDDLWETIEEKKLKVWDILHARFDIEYLDYFEIQVYCSRDGIFSSGRIQKI